MKLVSALINSISNFLLFKTLQDALEADVPSFLIPSQFTAWYENADKEQESILVNTQEIHEIDDNNEQFRSQGSSRTLNPRVYSFTCKDIELNIIDVPGLADAGGVNQDKISRKVILQEVNRFTEIHGICIVAHAATNRLTIEFKYALDEILSSLNKSAINNIMFIVTNCAGYEFTSGLVIEPLMLYIEQLNKSRGLSLDFRSNVFCVDNDVFRFLVAWNQSEKFREAHQNKITPYEKNWERSRKAVFSLLKRIYVIDIYGVEDTKNVVRASTGIQCAIPSLNSAREVIVQANDEEYKQKKISFFMENGIVKKSSTQVQNQEQPQLVCIHGDCIKMFIDPKTNTQAFDFSNPCHKDCHIDGVAEVEVGDPAIEQCHKIDLNGNCRECGHSFKFHMHVPYRATTTISYNANNFKALCTRQEAEDYYKIFIKNTEEEERTMSRELGTLAAFLQRNAIVKYNTAFEQRLMYEISVEERLGNHETIKNLRKSIEDHKTQIAIINSAQDDKERNVEVADVEKSLKTLFSLPLYGNTIQHLYENELPASEAADPKDFIRCKVNYIPD